MANLGILRKIFVPAGANPDEVRMTLGEHLEELRSRLIRALAGLAIGAAVCWYFIGEIQSFLMWPVFAIYRKHGLPTEVKALAPTEQFMTDLKVALIVGIIVSAPYSIAQIWGFIAAGLYPNERKWVRGFAPVSIGLFFTGALFLIIVVNPLLLDFLVTYRTELPDIEWAMPTRLIGPSEIDSIKVDAATASTPVDPLADMRIPSFQLDAPTSLPEGTPWLAREAHEMRVRYGGTTYTFGRLQTAGKHNRVVTEIRLSEIVPFTLELAAAFGLGFQVPVVVAFIAVIGVLSSKEMAGYRRHVVLVMAVGAAIITPSPDPFSMTLLLLPMIGLFEAGLFAARAIERSRAQAAG